MPRRNHRPLSGAVYSTRFSPRGWLCMHRAGLRWRVSTSSACWSCRQARLAHEGEANRYALCRPRRARGRGAGAAGQRRLAARGPAGPAPDRGLLRPRAPAACTAALHQAAKCPGRGVRLRAAGPCQLGPRADVRAAGVRRRAVAVRHGGRHGDLAAAVRGVCLRGLCRRRGRVFAFVGAYLADRLFEPALAGGGGFAAAWPWSSCWPGRAASCWRSMACRRRGSGCSTSSCRTAAAINRCKRHEHLAPRRGPDAPGAGAG